MNALSPALHVFQSNQVRTVIRNDDPWFIALDVAKILEYRNAGDMTRILDADESDTHNVRIRSLSGIEQDRKLTIINESGLHHATLRSRKPVARAFRKWVTGTVLPTIRKSGRYEPVNPPTVLHPDTLRYLPLGNPPGQRYLIRCEEGGGYSAIPVAHDAYILTLAQIARGVGIGQDLPFSPAQLAQVIEGASGRLARVLGKGRAGHRP